MNKNKYVLLLFILCLSFILPSCGEDAPTEVTPTVTYSTCAHQPSDPIIDKEPSLDSTGTSHTECIFCGFILDVKTVPSITYTSVEINDILRPSLIRVYAFYDEERDAYMQGSGFFIDEKGTFITSAHVIEDCLYISVIDHTGKEYEVDQVINYVYLNDAIWNDYAVCRISDYKNSKPVVFTDNVKIGDTVFTVGFPGGIEKPFAKQGTVVDEIYTDFLISTAYATYGSSGGVLVNDKARVLGVVTATSDGYVYVLRNSMMIKDINKDLPSGKTPLEYFHPNGIPNETTDIEQETNETE